MKASLFIAVMITVVTFGHVHEANAEGGPDSQRVTADDALKNQLLTAERVITSIKASLSKMQPGTPEYIKTAKRLETTQANRDNLAVRIEGTPEYIAEQKRKARGQDQRESTARSNRSTGNSSYSGSSNDSYDYWQQRKTQEAPKQQAPPKLSNYILSMGLSGKSLKAVKVLEIDGDTAYVADSLGESYASDTVRKVKASSILEGTLLNSVADVYVGKTLLGSENLRAVWVLDVVGDYAVIGDKRGTLLATDTIRTVKIGKLRETSKRVQEAQCRTAWEE